MSTERTQQSGQSPQSPSRPTLDFDLEYYKLNRAHEVALNNATATYEQSLLRLILIFNTACIAGFLTLIQAKDSIINPDLALAPIWLWVAGIGAAFSATALGYLSQRAFTQAYRSRRIAMEMFRALTADWTAVPFRAKADDSVRGMLAAVLAISLAYLSKEGFTDTHTSRELTGDSTAKWRLYGWESKPTQDSIARHCKRADSFRKRAVWLQCGAFLLGLVAVIFSFSAFYKAANSIELIEQRRHGPDTIGLRTWSLSI